MLQPVTITINLFYRDLHSQLRNHTQYYFPWQASKASREPSRIYIALNDRLCYPLWFSHQLLMHLSLLVLQGPPRFSSTPFMCYSTYHGHPAFLRWQECVQSCLKLVLSRNTKKTDRPSSPSDIDLIKYRDCISLSALIPFFSTKSQTIPITSLFSFSRIPPKASS